MRQLIVKQLDYDLTPVAGLALVGHHLQRLAPVFKQIDQALPVRTGVANGDILRSYLGLLVQGKSDFDAVESFRGDAFFKQALNIVLLPSSPTLRQRMDAEIPDRVKVALALHQQAQVAAQDIAVGHTTDHRQRRIDALDTGRSGCSRCPTSDKPATGVRS